MVGDRTPFRRCHHSRTPSHPRRPASGSAGMGSWLSRRTSSSPRRRHMHTQQGTAVLASNRRHTRTTLRDRGSSSTPFRTLLRCRSRKPHSRGVSEGRSRSCTKRSRHRPCTVRRTGIDCTARRPTRGRHPQPRRPSSRCHQPKERRRQCRRQRCFHSGRRQLRRRRARNRRTRAHERHTRSPLFPNDRRQKGRNTPRTCPGHSVVRRQRVRLPRRAAPRTERSDVTWLRLKAKPLSEASWSQTALKRLNARRHASANRSGLRKNGVGLARPDCSTDNARRYSVVASARRPR